MTNTAEHVIHWSTDGEGLYWTASSEVFSYSEWFIEPYEGGFHVYLTRMDLEGTTPDQDFSVVDTLIEAKELARRVEEEWL